MTPYRETPRDDGYLYQLPQDADDIARARYSLTGDLDGLNIDIGIRTDGSVGLFQVAHRKGFENPPDITARLLRDIPFGHYRERAERELVTVSKRLPLDDLDPESKVAVAMVVATLRAAGAGDFDALRMAKRYDELVAEGNPSPVPELASRLHMSRSTVYRLLKSATKKKWLHEAPKGRTSRGLTEEGHKAVAVLLGDDEHDEGN